MLRLDDVEAIVSLASGIDMGTTDVTIQEGFIMSRVDSRSTVKEICMSSGLGLEATMQIMASLRDKGLIMLGDEPPEPLRPAAPILRSPLDDISEDIVPDGEDYPMKKRLRAYIRDHYGRLEEMNFFELLSIEPTTDLAIIRRAFLLRTKEFHPDRYFGREIGPYGEMIRELFKHVVRAYRFFEDVAQREAYVLLLRQKNGKVPSMRRSPVQSAAAAEAIKNRQVKKRWHNEEVVSQAEDLSTGDEGGYCFVRKKK